MTTFSYLLLLIGVAAVLCTLVLSMAIAVGGDAGRQLAPPPTVPADA